MELRQAKRKNAKMKLALQGSAGCGKSLSALLLASGMTDWSKIAVIDTENNSADLYSHLGNYNVVQFDKPYTPERYIKAIEVCEDAGMEVIIADSISPEWEYILDLHGSMPGNGFANWQKVNKIHNAFVKKILESQHHIICTIRSKSDYTMTDKNGKVVPEKVGLKGIQRDGIDFEFTIVFDLDIKHFAAASKDRSGLFADKPETIITAEHGKRILNWCNEGISIDEVKEQIQLSNDIESLRTILKTYPGMRKDIEPLAIKRKEFLHAQIINQTKISGNGIDTSK